MRPGQIIDPNFHKQNMANAIPNSLPSARPVTDIGTGTAEIRQVASNRRFLNADGTPNYGRYSSRSSKAAKTAPEGTIDPMLRVLIFWGRDTPVAMLNVYATHPMSYYRTGRVSAEFSGRARERLQSDRRTDAASVCVRCERQRNRGQVQQWTL